MDRDHQYDDAIHSQSDPPEDRSQADADFGVWTETFERLHQAASGSAPTASVERLVAAMRAEQQAEWRELGLCRQVDPDLFYPAKGKTCAAAKRVCAKCPVRDECLRAALARREAHGVWGGTSPTERARLHRAACRLCAV